MTKIIIDAENEVVGRMGSYVAKELLKGNEVMIVNSEKAIISGNKDDIAGKLRKTRKKGGYSMKGPLISKMPDRLLKRMIRGMLPWETQRGRTVYRNLKCYVGNKTNEKAKKLNIQLPRKYITIKQMIDLL
ncbi:MAG: 50S ribosomal protein L13 [Nanoarchaeota archaeon]|nr:50S ribosomal protein L13 [Nanoarchaeota archaeon]